jgi:DNA primase
MSNQNAKEIIKAKLSIESVVGSYVKLEKSGKNFRACCPFHSEKTPSFYVTPDRGIFYCYGCQKGGDIFSFVQEIEGVSFYEALKSLADKAGVVLEKGSHEADTKISIQREIMEIATRYYEVGLRTEKSAVDYLLQRGLLKETLVDWRIGYAKKGWSGLYDTLKKKGYSDADIQKTGLCVPGNRGMYDRFRERIMFPIMDPQGRVIAFTGRVLPGTEEAGRPVGK